MVKSTTLAITAIASAFPALVAAKNCTPGLDYCGETLMAIGKYKPQILAAMKERGYNNSDEWTWENAVFYCIGGENGDIRLRWTCKENEGYCQNNGNGKSDACVKWGWSGFKN